MHRWQRMVSVAALPPLESKKPRAACAGGAFCRCGRAYNPAAARKASALSIFSQVKAVKVSAPTVIS